MTIEAFLNNEQRYLNQLISIRNSFSLPLLSQNTIEPSRRSSFHDTLFGNYQLITTLHENIIQDLITEITGQNHILFNPSSTHLGDLIYSNIVTWKEPYLRYASNYAFATYYYTLEYNRNTAFARLMDDQQQQDNDNNVPLIDLLGLPITYIPTCLELLKAISTYDFSIDRCVVFMTDLLQSMQEANRVATAEQRLLEIRQSQPSAPDDLVYEGAADLVVSSHKNKPILRCHLMLFTHALWITRQITNVHGETEYVLVDQPIPVAMLRVIVSQQQQTFNMDDQSDEGSISTAYSSSISGLRIRHRIRRIKQRIHHPAKKTHHKLGAVTRHTLPPSFSSSDSRWLQIGHIADPHIVYTFSCMNRLEWLKKIKSVIPDPEAGPFQLSLQLAFHEPILASLTTSNVIIRRGGGFHVFINYFL